MQILIFGMHRSGTSVVARLLNMMGVYFAPEGVSNGANEENPKGFWERRDVRVLNDLVLHSAGADWDRLSAFSLSQVPKPTLVQFKKEAAAIALAMDAYRPWFLKEPRFCVLAQLWLELLEVPVCLFVHRSPLEIARSLEMRNGFPITFGLALWERYCTRALNATRKQRRLQVNHGDLMTDPVATLQNLRERLEKLGVQGLRSPSKEEILAFIDPSLYRAREPASAGGGQPNRAQRKLWDAFQQDTAMRSTKLIRFSRAAQQVLIRHDQLTQSEDKVAELEGRNRSLSTELSSTRTQLARREEKARLMKAASEKRERNAATTQHLHNALQRGVEFLRQVIKSDAEISSLREEKAKSKAELERREAEILGVREEEARSKAELQRLRHGLAQLNQTIAHHAATLAEQRARVAELTQKNRILNKGLDAIEGYFRRLRDSRSFHFMVYTARRLGLVSRTPRRCLEAINNQFPAIRKAVKQVRATVPVHPAAVAAAEGKTSVAAATKENRSSIEATNAVGPSVPATNEVSPSAVAIGELRSDRERRIAEAAASRAAASAQHTLSLPASITHREEASVCFVILHRGGENHLHNLFSSFITVNTLPGMEFIVVLHACTDRSREVIQSYQDRLRIKITDCKDNYSFAYSNNRAAEQTSAEYLVFLNNDIIFQEDLGPELLRGLGDLRTGIVGVRLLFPADDPKYPNTLQHGGVKFWPNRGHLVRRPFNLGAHVDVLDTPPVSEIFPAVTAALAACRRAQFLELGGFCEDYFYGYEDVDLCLSFRRRLGLRSVCLNQVSAIHNESATGCLDASERIEQRRRHNTTQLIRRHGWYLRRQCFIDKMAGVLFFSDKPLTIAFAVTEATSTTAAGDFFTASELGEACAMEFGWRIRYLSRKDDWYNLRDVDVLVVLLDGYELSKIRDASPDLVKIAWLRNWFERWASRPEFDEYDLFLCSSEKAATWLRETQRKRAWVFPLATNPARFSSGRSDSHLRSDYCFTGSYWQLEREIESAVQPDKLDGYKFLVFGSGWDNHFSLGAHAQGFVPYSEMPNVYASTRIVLDDANHVTKNWGSVNSRVFDALAAGALVITNGEAGAVELFDGLLPTYNSPNELQSLLRRYLEDETQRQALTDRLRQRVLSHHTYRHRARMLKKILISQARRGYRIAIKIGTPTRAQIQHWGDYHFARSLGRCLAAQGHSCRIDCLDEWERPESFADDVVIVLRGLSRYRTTPGQINLMWNISHPDEIHDDEYEEFDHVFVASQIHAADLARRLCAPVSVLLQCTDPYVFYPDPNPAVPAEELLFVGNSRKHYREAVRFAVQANLPVAVYGTFWSGFLPPGYIRGEHIDNSVLRQHYSRCSILLNDHWPSMRERGFISNRIFDAAAAGAFVLSDAVEGSAAALGEDVVTYRTEDEFIAQAKYYQSRPEERRACAERLRSRVLSAHTFGHRAGVILTKISELDEQKRSIGSLTAARKPARSVTARHLYVGHRRRKAAVVAWDMGHNPVGRAHVLYQLLERDWDVELVGPSWTRYGSGLWGPLADLGLNVRLFSCRDLDDFLPQMALEVSRIKYDLVYVGKPRLPSLLLGLGMKEHSHCPMILDIDDFELSFFQSKTSASLADLRVGGRNVLREPYEEVATRYSQSLIPYADAITVSNTVLQQRYGGTIIRHARDETAFSPGAFDREQARRELGISPQEFALVFVGTPRPHKGIYEVARTLHELGDDAISFHIVGSVADRRIEKELRKYDRARITLHPDCSFAALPRILSAADCVPLLQDPSHPIAEWQIPAKISDATALGLPVVITDVAPIRDLAADGIIVIQKDQLGQVILDLKAQRERGETNAEGIRQFFLDELSLSVNRTRLTRLIEALPQEPKPLPPDFEELKTLLLKTLGESVRTYGAGPVSIPISHFDSDKTKQFDVAFFWKQNDSGLYGRRSDMIAKYLLNSGQVRRIMFFDAPIELDKLRRGSSSSASDSHSERNLILRNTIARWAKSLDSDRLLQRVFIASTDSRGTLFGSPVKGEKHYLDFVEDELRANDFQPASTIAWVCPVVWQFPQIAHQFHFSAVITDLIDDQRAWKAGADFREQLDQSYKETLELSDVVFTNCEPVANAFREYAGDIYVVPNGAERFDLVRDVEVPDELKRLPRPIIGYVGNMRDRIDWLLLGDLVARRPEWSFIFAGAGDDSESARQLVTFPNVTFIGVVEYSNLLAFLRGLDVAIVPHLHGEMTQRMNPLKVYNYLAAGVPVVSTEIPNLGDAASFIRVAQDSASFISAIEQSLETQQPETENRRRFLEMVSWESRVAEMLTILLRKCPQLTRRPEPVELSV